MKKIGPQIAKWVENQQETAEMMGISPASLNQMLSGKIRLPLPRFLQIMYYRNPPQAEANDIFKEELDKLGYDKYVMSEVTFVPDNYIALDEETTEKVMSLIEALEDIDDVQNVYHNLEI